MSLSYQQNVINRRLFMTLGDPGSSPECVRIGLHPNWLIYGNEFLKCCLQSYIIDIVSSSRVSLAPTFDIPNINWSRNLSAMASNFRLASVFLSLIKKLKSYLAVLPELLVLVPNKLWSLSSTHKMSSHQIYQRTQYIEDLRCNRSKEIVFSSAAWAEM